MRCKYCNEVVMGDFHKEEDCAIKEVKNEKRIEDVIKAELIYWMIDYPKQKKLLKEFTDKLIVELRLMSDEDLLEFVKSSEIRVKESKAKIDKIDEEIDDII